MLLNRLVSAANRLRFESSSFVSVVDGDGVVVVDNGIDVVVVVWGVVSVVGAFVELSG